MKKKPKQPEIHVENCTITMGAASDDIVILASTIEANAKAAQAPR